MEATPNPQKQVKRPQSTPVRDLPTPVNWYKLKLWLNGYDSTKFKELVFGFRLGFGGPRLAQDGPNLQSALSNQDIVNQKIQAELRAGRIAGPFKDKPFKNSKVSP